MSPEDPFAFMTDQAGKLAGQIARIAGLLHLARYATCRSLPEKVAEEDMKKGIAIGCYLSDRALAVFDLMGANPAHDGARAILETMQKSKRLETQHRDLNRQVLSHRKRARKNAPQKEAHL